MALKTTTGTCRVCTRSEGQRGQALKVYASGKYAGLCQTCTLARRGLKNGACKSCKRKATVWGAGPHAGICRRCEKAQAPAPPAPETQDTGLRLFLEARRARLAAAREQDPLQADTSLLAA